MSAYTQAFGLAANSKGGIGEILFDLDSTRDNAKAGWGAGDTISVLLPVGTQVLNAVAITDATWTGTISLGLTGATTGIMSTVTPGAAGVAISAQAALNTTTVSIVTLDSVTYLVLTIASANTTGKLRLSVLVHAPAAAKVS